MSERADLLASARRLAARGLIAAAEGNLSLRLPDGWLLVTPSGRRKDELEEADLLEARLDPGEAPPAAATGPRPSSDLAIHRAIYAARPDVRAIVHAHVPAAMALTLVGEAPDPLVLPETALHLPRVPVVPFGEMGSAELAARVASTFAQPDEPAIGAVLLERHGAIAVGPDIVTALNRMELVDVLCRVWRDARLLAPDRRPVPPA